MSYLLAVASTDGSVIDTTFGAAQSFRIYEAEGTRFEFRGIREIPLEEGGGDAGSACGPGSGCGHGGGGGCGATSGKVEHLSDVRTILATKVGFQAQKQLEKKAISTFDLEADVDEALKKITAYYDRVDRHESLRGIR